MQLFEFYFCFFSASQLIKYRHGDGIEVAMGGGWRNFYKCGTKAPDGAILSGKKCRSDGRDLTKEWVRKFDKSAYVTNRTQLNNIDADKVDHLLGEFHAQLLRSMMYYKLHVIISLGLCHLSPHESGHFSVGHFVLKLSFK